MKTIACVLSLFLLASCDVLRGVQADPKNPANLLALLVAVNDAKVQTSADLRAMRDAAPGAFDAADKNHDGYLQPRELPRFLIDGKLEARAAFVQVLRNSSERLRARGDAESVELAGKVDAVLADVDGWLVLIDLFER
jgi:hypothetical protein